MAAFQVQLFLKKSTYAVRPTIDLWHAWNYEGKTINNNQPVMT